MQMDESVFKIEAGVSREASPAVPVVHKKSLSRRPPHIARARRNRLTLPEIKHFVIQKSTLIADLITVVLIMVFALFTLCSVISLFATLVAAFRSPEHFILGFDMHADVLGSFFYVLIGEELLHSTLLHFDKNTEFAEGTIAVAITAVCRKIIIINYNTASWQKLFVMACMTLGLSFGVWAVREKR